MRIDAWMYRVGETLALLAIYNVVGGPNVWNGGGLMAAAAFLMAIPILNRGIGIIRRRRNRQEVPA